MKRTRPNAENRTTRTKPPLCSSKTRYGMPCRHVSDPRDPEGRCGIHQKSDEERKLLMQQARAIRKKNQLRPHELMRVVIESNPIAFMQPYLDALGIRIIFVPDENDPEMLHPTAIMDPMSHGTTLFGVSKEGKVIVSKHKDIEAQQRAAERLFDRVYGKPKQTNVLAGSAVGNDDPNIVPFDERRQAEVAAILEAARRPSHQN